MGLLGALVIGGLAAAGGIGGSLLAADAAGDVADAQQEAALSSAEAQVEAAEIAAAAQADALRESLNFQQGIFDIGQANLAPFLQAGQGAVGDLAQLLQPGGAFLTQLQQPFEFGLEDFQQDPGFKFRLEEGERALNRAAASRGDLVSGGQLRDLVTFGQGQASQEFGAARNRALQEFQTGRTGQLDVANLLGNLAGLGQVTGQAGAQAGSQFGQAGGQTLGQIGGVIGQGALQSGQATAQGIINAANAASAGQVSQANLTNDILGQVGQIPLDIAMLQRFGLFGGGVNTGPLASGAAEILV